MAIDIPLILGGFIFDPFELSVPSSMGDLGGIQAIAQRDFPGGIRTHQGFGYFPAPIRWQARFSGGDASNRAEQVKRILAAGQEVTLTYGERAWQGRLARFSPTARHSFLFEYDLEFWPRLDLSSGIGEFTGAPDPQTVMDLHVLALQSIMVETASFFPNVMPTLLAPIRATVNAVESGLLIAGSLAALGAADQGAIVLASAGLLAACAPLQASLDPRISSPAYDIAAHAQVISNLATTAQTARWVVQAVNPNLFTLAAMYYGEAAAWRRIATVNGLSDPQPIGTYRLAIPAP